MDSSINFNLTATQHKVLMTEAQNCLFGGALGGGKSYLLRAYAIFLAMNIRNCQIYLFRRYSKELLLNHMVGSQGFYHMLGDWVNYKICSITQSPLRIKFNNGSAINLCYCESPKDSVKFQGAELNVFLVDEASSFPYPILQFLFTRLRINNTPELREDLQALRASGYNIKLPMTILATNPGGLSHHQLKNNFIDKINPGEIITLPDEIGGGGSWTYIPSTLEDNPHLNTAQYSAQIKALGDPGLEKAFLEGDWGAISSSGAFFRNQWSEANIVEPFIIPSSWYCDRCFDYGSSAPSATAWVAESNGEDYLDVDGNSIPTVEGDLFVFFEFVTCKPTDISKGTGMLAADIADAIKEIDDHFNKNNIEIHPGPADNSIETNTDGNSIAKTMAKQGIEWAKSDKSPGSRSNGAAIMKEYLNNAKTGKGPALYFFANCKISRATIPLLPVDPKKPDDVDTTANDHIYDCIRYRVLTKRYETVNTGAVVMG